MDWKHSCPPNQKPWTDFFTTHIRTKNLALRHPNAHPWGIVTQSAILPTVSKWVSEHVHFLKRICPIHLCTCNDDGSPALEIWGLDGSCPKILKQDSPNRTAPNRKGYHFCCPQSAMNELGSSKSCKTILRKLVRFLKFGGVRFLW